LKYYSFCLSTSFDMYRVMLYKRDGTIQLCKSQDRFLFWISFIAYYTYKNGEFTKKSLFCLRHTKLNYIIISNNIKLVKIRLHVLYGSFMITKNNNNIIIIIELKW